MRRKGFPFRSRLSSPWRSRISVESSRSIEAVVFQWGSISVETSAEGISGFRRNRVRVGFRSGADEDLRPEPVRGVLRGTEAPWRVLGIIGSARPDPFTSLLIAKTLYARRRKVWCPKIGYKVKKMAKTGIQILAEKASQALGTLSGNVALAVATGHGTGLLRSFLMKKVKLHACLVEGLTAKEGNGLIVGMARGDASVGEIKAALEDIQLEDDRKTQAAKRDVLHEAIWSLDWENFDGTAVATSDPSMVSLGGGNGIPFEEGDGWQWFVYKVNTGNLTTGSTLAIHATYWGIWL